MAGSENTAGDMGGCLWLNQQSRQSVGRKDIEGLYRNSFPHEDVLLELIILGRKGLPWFHGLQFQVPWIHCF